MGKFLVQRAESAPWLNRVKVSENLVHFVCFTCQRLQCIVQKNHNPQGKYLRRFSHLWIELNLDWQS